MRIRRPSRLSIVHGALALFALALVTRAAKVQLLDGAKWAARADRQHFVSRSLPAKRGMILDASGNALVETRELTRISIAPSQLRDRAAASRLLKAAGVPAPWVARAVDVRRKWVELPGAFQPRAVGALLPMRGVYATPVVDRVYSDYAGIRRLVGRVDPRGAALDGVELAFDSLLRGDSVTLRLARDRSGRAIAPERNGVLAATGATVVLTINQDLQDITERSLAQAIDSLGASGGDIVVMNPYSGHLLALASRRADPSASANTAISEPFEPGSTLKPFVAAALIERGRAQPDDTIGTFNGQLELEGRVIHDVHKAAWLSLSDVIRFSSNVGIVRFAERLAPREKYELLRDLGFGSPTGVALPAEAGGTLREPRLWSRQSSASLVMGYEIAVTPLQLAAAYAALANGGELVEPQLVKEIRRGERVVFAGKRRVIRRVFSPATAAAVQRMLVEVVRSGTATKTDLANFEVGGKSGTARRTVGGRGYEPGRYTASFVGLFPAERPQYVILVKLDDPRKVIYGGEAAAPVTRVVLQAALAARDAALDRNALAGARRPAAAPVAPLARVAARPADSTDSGRATVAPPPGGGILRAPPGIPAIVARPRGGSDTVTRAVMLPLPVARERRPQSTVSPLRQVPDVAGLTARDAVRTLHAAGFRVHVVRGEPNALSPAPGSLLPTGSVVRLSLR